DRDDGDHHQELDQRETRCQTTATCPEHGDLQFKPWEQNDESYGSERLRRNRRELGGRGNPKRTGAELPTTRCECASRFESGLRIGRAGSQSPSSAPG